MARKLKSMPKEEGLDQTLSVLREGYMYITNRRAGFQSDVFETSLLGEKAICMTGEEAASLFYDNDKFTREGAAPKRAQKTLLGEKGVQNLDGEVHRHRKAMFMSLMGPEKLKNLTELIQKEWEKKIDEWSEKSEIVLYEEAQELLFRAACKWAGVPVEEGEVAKKTRATILMIESPLSIGIQYVRGKQARKEMEKWIEDLIVKVRNQELEPLKGSALDIFSRHRNLEGSLLDEKTAAVEVLNIIRPIVAIAIYISFTAAAVIQHPQERKNLDDEDEKSLEMFIQEVRRYYPFFPFNGARVKEDFVWKEYQFKKGTLTLLDFYGTNHDPLIWNSPELFNPQRFIDWKGTPFSFIPQGGGDHYTGHRCAGEWATIEVMKVSLIYLANRISFEIPEQDLHHSMVSMPSLPNSEIILRNIRRRQ